MAMDGGKQAEVISTLTFPIQPPFNNYSVAWLILRDPGSAEDWTPRQEAVVSFFPLLHLVGSLLERAVAKS